MANNIVANAVYFEVFFKYEVTQCDHVYECDMEHRFYIGKNRNGLTG